MRNFLAQKEFMDIIAKCQIEFEKSLKYRKVMIIQ